MGYVRPYSGTINLSSFVEGTIDPDSTMAANSDTVIPTQKAVKTITDALNTAKSDKSYVDAQNMTLSNKVGDLTGAGLTETDLSTAIKNDRTNITDVKLQSFLLTPIDIEGLTLGNIRLPENPIIIPNTITLG